MIPLHDDNPTEIKPWLTIGLVVICVLIFLSQLSLGRAGGNAMLAFGVIPAVLFNFKQLPPELSLVPAWMSIFTSMFLHGGWMHLISNMLFLWIFGNNVEDAMGHKRFFIFYFLCGAISVFAQILPNPQSPVPLIGASGAISGVLGAYILLYPHARILVMVPIIIIMHTVRMPAYWVLGFWFFLQIFNSAAATNQQGGVAWGAHIGGFIAGMILIPFFKKKEVRLFHPKNR